VIREVADFPPLVAVIVAAPAVTPLTSPVAETVATPGALLVHVTVLPAGVVVAVSCLVAPTAIVALVGETVIAVTVAGLTVTLAVPETPSLVAVIVTAPVATPFTRPFASTVATKVLLLDHVTARPEGVVAAVN
jgi:hypothetical protein